MNQGSRTSNVIKNIIGGIGGQIFTSLLMFVCRTYFINLLGATYLGVNGLFSNILSMLSLAELGIGPAIVFSMYKPIADNDELQVAKLMNFYKMAYRFVALVILTIGLLLLPFLDVFIKDTSGIEHLRLIFVLILSNTVVSYLYSYKGSMLSADQKAYVTVIIRNVFSIVVNILQIIGLILTGNYYLYLIISIVVTFASNLFLSYYVDKTYPFLIKYKREKITASERKEIIKRVEGMMMHKLGGFVLNGTDNMLISKFVGVVAVGIYSNYLMIINLVKTYVTLIVSSIGASVGNLIASEKNDKSYEVFKASFFIHFLLYSFCFMCMWIIFEPFVTVWLGNKYLMSKTVLLIVLLNFFLYGMQECINTFTNATGLFWETRYKPIAECIINIGASITLGKPFGMFGVFAGTLASYLCSAWINPIVIYKKHFKVSVIRYFVRYAMYIVIALFITLFGGYLCNILFEEATILNIVLRLLVGTGIYLIAVCLLFGKTSEFRYCIQMVKHILHLKNRKVN